MEIKNIFSLGELFEQVQLHNIFPDNKTFVDCTFRENISFIHERYEEEKQKKDFDLKRFVEEYFSLPEKAETSYTSSSERPIINHIEMLWEELAREPKENNDSLLPLPYPYIIPGGRFREIYYWDSYFTMLGLQISGRSAMIQNMIDNFSHLIDTIGYIPNGNRSYYIGRSQPPFYALMVQLLSEEKDKDILVKYLPQLEKEYNFWMKGSDQLSTENLSVNRVSFLPDGNILNHYWDDNDTPRPESYKEDAALAHDTEDKENMYRNLRAAAESGWDFSSRWFKDVKDFSSIHTTEIIPVDLNCLLYNLEHAIADAYYFLNDTNASEIYFNKAAQRKKAIDTYCWNEEERFYFDYDYITGTQKRSLTLAGTFPLFFNIASTEQAEGIANKIEKIFLKDGGLITTTETTNQQWDAPNGWAPLQWIAIKGLMQYGYKDLATGIAKRWLSINEKVYNNTGKMMEKYDVVNINLEAGGGEYPAQDGFGWTNGVYLALQKLIKE